MHIRENKCNPLTQFCVKCQGSFTHAEYSKHFVTCRVGCKECGRFFKNKTLKEHILHNSKCIGIQCIFCKVSFPIYEGHKCKQHPLTKSFHCIECDMKFTTLKLRERHFLEVHRNINIRKKFCCSFCSKAFYGFKNYYDHCLNIHKFDVLKNKLKILKKCSLCDISETFSSRDLQMHMTKTHNMFYCLYCPQLSYSKKDFLFHMSNAI